MSRKDMKEAAKEEGENLIEYEDGGVIEKNLDEIKVDETVSR